MYVWGALNETHSEATTVADAANILRFPVRHPTFPPAGETVTCFSVGVKHVVAVSGGVVYGMGCNASGQLGKLVPAFVETFRPLGFSSQSPVVEVACGFKHTMIRTEDGNVYSCGDNTFRQLGHTARAAAGWNHVRVAHVKQIVSGGNTSYAVTTRGEVFSWGSVRGGALGHGTRGEKERVRAGAEEYDDVVHPTVIDWFVNKRVRVVELSAAKDHFVCRSDAEVFVCGDGSYGKLGQGDNKECLEPVRMTFPERKYKERLVAVSAGGDQTVVLKDSSEFGSIIYVCGRIGSGTDRYITPELLTIPDAGQLVKVFAGHGVCYACAADGRVFGWGNPSPVRALGTSFRAEKKTTVPGPIVGLNDGKFITDIKSSQFLFVASADDSRLAPGASAAVVVPFSDRSGPKRGGTVAAGENYDYDAARRATLSLMLGGSDNADTYIASLPQPVHEEAPRAAPLRKVGAHGLRVGSKIRVWMTDVYALAKVTRRDLPELSAKHFEVAWVRDDWDDEVVELRSEDETLSEANEDRWQRMWFPTDGDAADDG